MSHPRSTTNLIRLLVCILTSLGTGLAHGESISLAAIKETTLYQYDPNDNDSSLNSNGSGDFFSAGRSLNRSQIRRGLLEFDFSDIPSDAQVVPGTVNLSLYVVDVPRRDPAARPFWLIPAPDAWEEGASSANAGVSGSGSGVAAQPGDATWLHTAYDPAIHEGKPFEPNGQGYWGIPGVLGAEPLDPMAILGSPVGIIPSEIGPVQLQSSVLETHVNAWLGGATNFGWLILGDETLASNTESSLRGFASHEHANPGFHPSLSFDYFIPQTGSLDCNSDQVVDVGDLDCANAAGITSELLVALNLLPGDIDGVGGVAFPDFLILSANFGSDSRKYTEGNLDGVDGVVFADFLIQSSNFGKSAGATMAVPEPVSYCLMGWGAVLLSAVRRRHRSS